MNPFKHFLISALLVISIPVCAQGEPGDDPDAPIDGGLLLLIAGGIGYGIKKVHHINKARGTEQGEKL